MTFVLKMAWRDSRASRRRLALFSLSVVLGIAALVAIGSFTANLRQGIEDQAKGLLGADLVIGARSEIPAEAQRYIDALGGEQANEVNFSSMMVFPSAGDATRLVQVRAMDGDFPFYGDYVTAPAEAATQLRLGGDVAILEETLLQQFNVRVGDAVRLGQSTFTVIGAVQKIPGENMAIAMLAPRAFIPLSALEATGLSGRESLVRHRVHLKLPAAVDPLAVERDMRQKFREHRMSYDTVEERKRDLGRALTNIYGFLSLVGFIALFLGAIGVASAIHVYVRQKITTVAVLRCLGASARQSFSVYLVQGLALGIFGATLGAALGVALQLVLPLVVRDFLPFDVDFFISWAAVARGLVAGLVICLLFTLLPLLAVRRVSPLVALRSAFLDQNGQRRDPWRYVIIGAIGVAVAGFAVSQTRDWKLGLGFAGMLVASFGLLAGTAVVVAKAARRWFPRRVPYVVRQGVANLYRPNNRTVLLLLSLGLGTFLILTLYLTRTTLLNQIEGAAGNDRPNLLFFDVQDDQIEPLKELAVAHGTPVLQSAPIVTMKIAAVKGRRVSELLRERGTGIPSWTLRREYRSTYRGALAGTEKAVAGEFVGRFEPGATVVPISMEEGLARDMQLQIGDEIEWDVQGVLMLTRIASIRSVEWQRLQPNFFVVFPDGVLEPAPKFHVAALRAATTEDSANLQRAAVRAFPNVTAIDIALVMQTLDGIFSKVSFVIEFMALFTVVTGIVVLAGAVLTGRYQRIRETVLLRTLGATRRQLVQIQLVEYAILGVLAAVVGALLAVAASALLAHFQFKTTPSAPPSLLFAAVAAATAVTLLTGWFANRGVTNHPPLEVLREET